MVNLNLVLARFLTCESLNSYMDRFVGFVVSAGVHRHGRDITRSMLMNFMTAFGLEVVMKHEMAHSSDELGLNVALRDTLRL